MFDVCAGCGEVHLDMSVRPDGAAVVCPNCGHREPVHREPLLIVSGASATGKSTVLRELHGTREDVVMLDSDVLWLEEFHENTERFFRVWFRLCRDIAQSKRPPVLFGAGFGVPSNLEAHPQHECVSTVQYLALVCDDDEQRRRLRDRPSQRMGEAAIEDQVEFNQWFKENAAQTSVETVDTTDVSIETTAERVNQWISNGLADTTR